MLKEVLHHTYKLGLAIDTTGQRNDGEPVDVNFVSAGRQPGTGAAQFVVPSGRIHVDAKPAWDQPVAVQIDAWVKVVPPAVPRRLNIVEADRSFAFFIHPDHTLWGTFLAPPGPAMTPAWHGANTLENPVAGGPVAVPVYQWTKLTYLHDGFGTIRLYIDGSLAAQNNIWAAVSAVQPSGIEIGHWVGDDRYTFSGEIDDVRISIYDPNAIVEEFYCRLDAKTGACWDAVLAELAQLLENKEAMQQTLAVLACIQEAQRELLRAIVRAGPGTKHELAELRKRWLELWCNSADADKVVELMELFLGLFERVLGHRAWCALLAEMVDCVERLPLDAQRSRELFQKLAECDPWYAALIRAGGDRGLHRRCEERQLWRWLRAEEEGTEDERR
jgi:hypothetical protein